MLRTGATSTLKHALDRSRKKRILKPEAFGVFLLWTNSCPNEVVKSVLCLAFPLENYYFFINKLELRSPEWKGFLALGSY